MNITTYDLSRSCHRYHQGFTLVELMVTIAILAIIVGIAAPNISTQLANQRVKSTAATLKNALSEAKAESLIRRQDIIFSYSNSSSSSGIINIGNIKEYSYNTDSTIKGTTPITFNPRSKAVSTAATYTICDSNIHASPRQVVISRLAVISTEMGGTCP